MRSSQRLAGRFAINLTGVIPARSKNRLNAAYRLNCKGLKQVTGATQKQMILVDAVGPKTTFYPLPMKSCPVTSAVCGECA